MNGLLEEGRELASSLKSLAEAEGAPDCDWLICPPAQLLIPLAELLAGSPIALGGQDCHSAEKGAHTGDLSAAMLVDAGCSHVIVGHSERRQDHSETDATVRAKAEAACKAGLLPVVCLGETGEERAAGQTLVVIERQLRGSIPGGGDFVVAYEPVWAIGTGLTPSADDVAAAHAHIQALLETLVGTDKPINILYGGSVKPSNAPELLAVPAVGGALVGGASLKADGFWAIGSHGLAA